MNAHYLFIRFSDISILLMLQIKVVGRRQTQPQLILVQIQILKYPVCCSSLYPSPCGGWVPPARCAWSWEANQLTQKKDDSYNQGVPMVYLRKVKKFREGCFVLRGSTNRLKSILVLTTPPVHNRVKLIYML